MSSKKEDKKLFIPRCLVVTFKESSDKDGYVNDKPDSPASGSSKSKAEELFDSFVALNKLCYWDAHIRESFCGLQYFGCMKLHSSSRAVTILCSSKDIFLDTITTAWSKKVLQAPERYVLYKVGKSVHPVVLQALVRQALVRQAWLFFKVVGGGGEGYFP